VGSPSTATGASARCGPQRDRTVGALGSQERDRLLDRLSQVEWPLLAPPRVAQREHAADDGRDPLEALAQPRHEPAGPFDLPGDEVLLEQCQVVRHPFEGVVDLVGDAGGHAPDPGQPVAVEHLPLELAQAGLLAVLRGKCRRALHLPQGEPPQQQGRADDPEIEQHGAAIAGGQVGDGLEHPTLALAASQRPPDRRRPGGIGHRGARLEQSRWRLGRLLAADPQLDAAAGTRRGDLEQLAEVDPHLEQPAFALPARHRQLSHEQTGIGDRRRWVAGQGQQLRLPRSPGDQEQGGSRLIAQRQGMHGRAVLQEREDLARRRFPGRRH
jgi:hypothetical protein